MCRGVFISSRNLCSPAGPSSPSSLLTGSPAPPAFLTCRGTYHLPKEGHDKLRPSGQGTCCSPGQATCRTQGSGASWGDTMRVSPVWDRGRVYGTSGPRDRSRRAVGEPVVAGGALQPDPGGGLLCGCSRAGKPQSQRPPGSSCIRGGRGGRGSGTAQSLPAARLGAAGGREGLPDAHREQGALWSVTPGSPSWCCRHWLQNVSQGGRPWSPPTHPGLRPPRTSLGIAKCWVGGGGCPS